MPIRCKISEPIPHPTLSKTKEKSSDFFFFKSPLTASFHRNERVAASFSSRNTVIWTFALVLVLIVIKNIFGLQWFGQASGREKSRAVEKWIYCMYCTLKIPFLSYVSRCTRAKPLVYLMCRIRLAMSSECIV